MNSNQLFLLATESSLVTKYVARVAFTYRFDLSSLTDASFLAFSGESATRNRSSDRVNLPCRTSYGNVSRDLPLVDPHVHCFPAFELIYHEDFEGPVANPSFPVYDHRFLLSTLLNVPRKAILDPSVVWKKLLCAPHQMMILCSLASGRS